VEADAPARIGRHLDEIGAEPERLGPRQWGVKVPSERRGHVGVAVTCGERTLTLHAFFMRAPDRRHERVHERLLRKHLATYAWRFAIDDHGDLYLIAQTPLACVTAEELDRLLGSLSAYVDEVYEGVLREGFAVPEGLVFGPPPGASDNDGGETGTGAG
jgi:Putative bacterial sensory transduction regulator